MIRKLTSCRQLTFCANKQPRRRGVLVLGITHLPLRRSDFSSDATITAQSRIVTTVDRTTGIAHVSLNRPNKLNALDLAMFEAIAAEVTTLQSNRSIRAVILSGKGRAFCTGLDVKSILKSNPKRTMDQLLERREKNSSSSIDNPNNNNDDDDNEHLSSSSMSEISNLAQDVAYRWRSLPVPVICVLHGMAFGGGMQLALGADIRLATPDCQVSIMESKWGLIPDMSASVTLRELVRIDVAKELTMTGRVLSGTEAASLGLVTRCVDDPMAEAEKVAMEIVQRSPDSVAMSKRLYQQTWVAPEEYCLKVETELQKKLLATWNQLAASGRNFGVKLPYFQRKDDS